jgi:hypothetical protein
MSGSKNIAASRIFVYISASVGIGVIIFSIWEFNPSKVCHNVSLS